MINAGDILDSTYEIKEQIGAGGGGTIYLAYHKRLKKDVVLKKIHKSTSRNEEEKEILKNLKHSYLPQVYDFLEAEDGIYTVIDYIPGRSLDKVLSERGSLSQKQAVHYAIQLCEAVEYLHRQKPPIIHGDIKPGNLMLTPEDNICLIDFNISGVFGGNSAAVAGFTPGYASPEQMQAVKMNMESRLGNVQNTEETQTMYDSAETETMTEKGSTLFPEAFCRVDERSDVYSIGATVYHLITGKKPAADPEKIEAPFKADTAIKESISIILMKALEKNPDKRFQTVSEMLNAFQKLHKYDSRYKRLLRKQELMLIGSAACIGAGILTAFFGSRQIQTEKENEYVQAVAVLADAVSSSEDAERIEVLYEDARGRKPERLEAYFEKARFFYEQFRYEECREYIEKEILTQTAFYEQEEIADIYFMLANCYFEKENYDDAIINYRTAIDKNDSNPDYYRDYAIALVREGDSGKAEKVLRQAEEKGISSIDLLLVNGELAKAGGKFKEAEENFKRCIREAEDDYRKMRAYVMCDAVYRKLSGKAEEIDQKIKELKTSAELLEQARTDVGQEYQLLIYERLAQDYIDLQELTSADFYGESAIEVLEAVIERGWGNYITLHNIAILYQRLGDFERCRQTLLKMQELEPENYIAYKRMAFLEAEEQNQRLNQNRGYDQFVSFYKKAKELYRRSGENGKDAEMQLLDELYQQMLDGGWLK